MQQQRQRSRKESCRIYTLSETIRYRAKKVTYVTLCPVMVVFKLEALVPNLIVGAAPRPKGYLMISCDQTDHRIRDYVQSGSEH